MNNGGGYTPMDLDAPLLRTHLQYQAASFPHGQQPAWKALLLNSRGKQDFWDSVHFTKLCSSLRKRTAKCADRGRRLGWWW